MVYLFCVYFNDEDLIAFENAVWFFIDKTSELGVVFYKAGFSYSNYDWNERNKRGLEKLNLL